MDERTLVFEGHVRDKTARAVQGRVDNVLGPRFGHGFERLGRLLVFVLAGLGAVESVGVVADPDCFCQWAGLVFSSSDGEGLDSQSALTYAPYSPSRCGVYEATSSRSPLTTLTPRAARARDISAVCGL